MSQVRHENSSGPLEARNAHATEQHPLRREAKRIAIVALPVGTLIAAALSVAGPFIEQLISK